MKIRMHNRRPTGKKTLTLAYLGNLQHPIPEKPYAPYLEKGWRNYYKAIRKNFVDALPDDPFTSKVPPPEYLIQKCEDEFYPVGTELLPHSNHVLGFRVTKDGVTKHFDIRIDFQDRVYLYRYD